MSRLLNSGLTLKAALNVPLSSSKAIIVNRYSTNGRDKKDIFKAYKESLDTQDLYTASRLEPITAKEVGKKVIINGYIQSISKLSKTLQSIPIRRNNLITRCTVSEQSNQEVLEKLKSLKYESIVCIEGVVQYQNSNSQTNKKLEVAVSQLHILNEVNYQPFLPNNFESDLINEEIRLKNRFIDLRRKVLATNLHIRSKVYQIIRNYLVENHFLEVETPMLFKPTPEGAREFLIPTRRKGYFYALPQSPQQFKQLLIAAGVDRYFQIVKCFRDEDVLKDKQPEFTQLDLELAYTDEKGIKNLTNKLIKLLWKEILKIDIDIDSIPTLTYHQVMKRYGSDKPDLRIPFEIHSLNPMLKELCKVELPEDTLLQYIVIDREQLQLTNTQTRNLLYVTNKDKNSTISNVICKNYQPDQTFLIQPKVLNFTKEEWTAACHKLATKLNLDSKCTVFSQICPLPFTGGSTPLGKLRTQLASKLNLKSNEYKFLWVEEFPLMLPVDKGAKTNYAKYQPTHHPFTAPNLEDIELLKTEPLRCRGRHYDLVLNGSEVGSGSIRIHQPHIQKCVFDVIQMDKDGQQLFQHLLNGLDSGCPPHGGIALGLDRLLAALCNAPSLKEVIAFPKTNIGHDLTTKSPTKLTQLELQVYRLKLDA